MDHHTAQCLFLALHQQFLAELKDAVLALRDAESALAFELEVEGILKMVSEIESFKWEWSL